MNLTLRLTQKTQLLLTVILIGLCTGSIAILQRPILNQKQQSTTKAEYRRQEKLSATNLKILESFPSFGFNNLIADWMYLQFIQYFGDTEARNVTGYQLIPQYFQATLERDPRFASAYLKFSVANTIFAGQPKLSVQLLDQSLEHLSPKIADQTYQLWIYKATDELLFLGDLQAAKQSYQKAAEWAKQSNETGSDSLKRYAQRMVRFIETDPTTRKGRISAWNYILTTTDQEVVRQKAIKEIEALGGEVVTTPDGKIKRIKVPESN